MFMTDQITLASNFDHFIDVPQKNKHSKSTLSDMHVVSWKDKAGFIMFLKATTQLHLDNAQKRPKFPCVRKHWSPAWIKSCKPRRTRIKRKAVHTEANSWKCAAQRLFHVKSYKKLYVCESSCMSVYGCVVTKSPLSTLLGDALKDSKTFSQSFTRKEYIYNKEATALHEQALCIKPSVRSWARWHLI